MASRLWAFPLPGGVHVVAELRRDGPPAEERLGALAAVQTVALCRTRDCLEQLVQDGELALDLLEEQPALALDVPLAVEQPADPAAADQCAAACQIPYFLELAARNEERAADSPVEADAIRNGPVAGSEFQLARLAEEQPPESPPGADARRDCQAAQFGEQTPFADLPAERGLFGDRDRDFRARCSAAVAAVRYPVQTQY